MNATIPIGVHRELEAHENCNCRSQVSCGLCVVGHLQLFRAKRRGRQSAEIEKHLQLEVQHLEGFRTESTMQW